MTCGNDQNVTTKAKATITAIDGGWRMAFTKGFSGMVNDYVKTGN